MVTNTTEVLIPKCLQWGIDALSGGALPSFIECSSQSVTYWFVFALLLSILLIQALSRRYWRLSLGQETHRVGASLKSALWDRARFFSPYRLATSHPPGVLMNIATSDVGTARYGFGFTMIGSIDIVFLGSLTIVAMALIDWRQTLLSLGLLLFLPFLLHRLSGQEYRQHQHAQEALSNLNDLASGAVATVRLQRLSASSSFWENKLRDLAAICRDKRLLTVNTSLRFFLLMATAPIVSFAVLLFSSVPLVFDGTLSIGEFVALQSYVVLLQGPLHELGFMIAEWQRVFASLARIVQVYKQPADPMHEVVPRNDASRPTETPAMAYVLEAVSFSYPDTTRKIFAEISFTLPAGSRLGVKGPIGSGKSTLIAILSGCERGYTGSVRLFGQELREASNIYVRNAVSIVEQKPFLFAETIAANLQLGRTCDSDELWHALELAGIADEVRQLPQQMKTPLGEWGINLSGGQKQRITLARALIRAPRILLLDDCLSAVDTVTENRILTALDRELRKTTLVWAAHRESTLRYCSHFLDLSA